MNIIVEILLKRNKTVSEQDAKNANKNTRSVQKFRRTSLSSSSTRRTSVFCATLAKGITDGNEPHIDVADLNKEIVETTEKTMKNVNYIEKLQTTPPNGTTETFGENIVETMFSVGSTNNSGTLEMVSTSAKAN